MALVTLSGVRTPAHMGQPLECAHWQLQQGQKWLVLGANASGKTVFANVVSGRQALSRGQRRYAEGFDPQRDIALVSFEHQRELHQLEDRFDDSELREDARDPGTRVQQFLWGQCVSDADYAAALKQFGLQALTQSGFRDLSTGETRKLLLARAVLSKARVLILDDPLAGLDKASQAQFSQILSDVFKQLDTVILISSRVQGVEHLASHLLYLEAGSVIEQGDLSPGRLHRCQQLLQAEPELPDKSLSWPLPRSHTLPDGRELIRLENVSVSFQDKAVFHGLSWTMNIGQHALISGPNGCGKSTLLGMLLGENAKAYGQEVYLFGRKKGSGESIWELRQRFGIVSTDLQRRYRGRVSALDVVVSGLHDSEGVHRTVSDQDAALARAWIAIAGASELAERRFDRLSYGQQRLILIARAMVKQPSILILDEPCIGLDDHNRKLVLELVDAIASNSQTHILFVSHVADERPGCINQTLQFVRDDGEMAYRINVS